MRGETTVRRVTGAIVRRKLRRHLVTVDGLHNLPDSGTFVLVPSHRSYFDHFVVELLIGAAVGRPVWFLTKQESFTTYWSRLWTRAWYGIPVDRDRPTPDTLRAVQSVFASEEILCVYPEGTRNTEDDLLPFQPGAFRFAMSEGAPVIPVAIVGSETVLPKGQRRFHAEGRVHVVVGEPLLPPRGVRKQQAAQDLALGARTAVQRLLQVARQNAQAPAPPDLIDRAARFADQMITAALTSEGRLERADQRRLAFVVSVLGRMESEPLHLEVQRIRLRALGIARMPALLRILPAVRVGKRIERILRKEPEHAVANYLLGRWCLAVPTTLGGGRERAEAAFTVSARAAEPSDTRAIAGLAELQLADGRIVEARDSLERVAQAPVRPRTRDEARAKRARLDLATLDDRIRRTEITT